MSPWNSLWAWNHISWSASKPTLSPLLIARQSDQSEQPSGTSTRRSSEQPRSRPESSWSFVFFLELIPHDLVKTKLVLLHHHLTSSLLRPLDLLRRSLRRHQLLKLFLMSLYPSVSRLPRYSFSWHVSARSFMRPASRCSVVILAYTPSHFTPSLESRRHDSEASSSLIFSSLVFSVTSSWPS